MQGGIHILLKTERSHSFQTKLWIQQGYSRYKGPSTSLLEFTMTLLFSASAV